MASVRPTQPMSSSKMPTPMPLARPGSKLAKLLALMERPQGATVAEIAKATGWQKHTVRGAISGAVKKKLRQKVTIITQGERRAYTINKLGSVKPAKSASKSTKAQSARPAVANPTVAEPTAE